MAKYNENMKKMVLKMSFIKFNLKMKSPSLHIKTKISIL